MSDSVHMIDSREMGLRIERAGALLAQDLADVYSSLRKDLPPPEMIDLPGGGRMMLHSALPDWSKVLGWGIDTEPGDEEIVEVERVFLDRGFVPRTWLSPFHQMGFARNLGRHGWSISMWQQMLVRALTPADSKWVCPADIQIREADDLDAWTDLVTRGFGDSLCHSYEQEFLIQRGFAGLRDMRCFTAVVDGKPVGAANVLSFGNMVNTVAASVLSEYRRRGIHRALIQHRLKVSAEAGKEYAFYSCDPGGDSQRNAERMGFRVMYTRVMMEKRPT